MLLLVTLPAVAGLFGSQRIEQAGAVQSSALELRLGLASRLVVAQLDDVRSDLHMIGATSSVARYLHEPDAEGAAAVANDLQEFVATRDWCRRIVLAPPGREPVTAERAVERPVCGPLLAVVAGLSPGTMLLDRVAAPAGSAARLCFGLPLETERAGAAALVAEGDPAALFADVAALFPGDGGLFLADGHGRWVVEPPARVGPLVLRGLALSSWQGPAGGRWEIAVAGPARAESTSSAAPPHEWTAALVLIAGLVSLVIAQAIESRRRQRTQLQAVDS
jgi:hypothetical protein